jgi:hypothetical protein
MAQVAVEVREEKVANLMLRAVLVVAVEHS